MKVTQEKLPASQIGLEIEITPEMSSKAYEKALQEFTRNANIPGFRKGKVPRQVLMQRYGASIRASVVEDLIQDSLRQAIEKEKIQTLGQFSLRSSFDDLVGQFEPGAALTFAAAVDVPPEAQIDNYKGLSVQAEEVKYSPEKVDGILEDYRKRSATLVPIEGRAAERGDIAIVDFSGKFAEAEEGEDEPGEIPGGSAQDFQIELSDGKFIEGFVEGIFGMNSGETKEVAVTFPEGYPQEDLAGQPAIFTITLKELKEQELPELDDDFAQEVSAFETLAELRESLETRYQKEAEQKTKDNKQEALLKELVKHVEVDLPESLVKQEVDQAVTQTAMQFSQQGMDIKKMFTQEIVAMLRQQARPEAIARLQRTLALGEIAKKESIEVAASDVEAKMNEILAQYQGQEQEIDRDRLREVVTEDLLKDKILDWIEANGSVELVPEGSLKQEEEDEDEVAEAAEEPVAESAPVETEAAIEVEAEVVEEAPPAPKKTKTKAKAPKAE
jgi:trigger factor